MESEPQPALVAVNVGQDVIAKEYCNTGRLVYTRANNPGFVFEDEMTLTAAASGMAEMVPNSEVRIVVCQGRSLNSVTVGYGKDDPKQMVATGLSLAFSNKKSSDFFMTSFEDPFDPVPGTRLTNGSTRVYLKTGDGFFVTIRQKKNGIEPVLSKQERVLFEFRM